MFLKHLFYKILRKVKGMEIKTYDYKEQYKLSPQKRYYGIELEIVSKKLSGKIDPDEELELDGSDLPSIAKGISKFFEGWAFFKHDGSLANVGFEIVTIPLSFEQQFEKWTPEIFKILNKKGFLSYEAQQSCGMHIHVSRSGLSKLQIGKILKFLHHKSNRVFLKKIAQRHSDQYAEFKSKKTFGYVKTTMGKSKYDALNLGHGATIEFRLFKGTLDYKAFCKNIEFCEALINFCAPCNVSVSESLNWFNFANFVEKNRKKYSFLWEYLIKKEMENIDSWAKHQEFIKLKKEKQKQEKIDIDNNIYY